MVDVSETRLQILLICFNFLLLKKKNENFSIPTQISRQTFIYSPNKLNKKAIGHPPISYSVIRMGCGFMANGVYGAVNPTGFC